MTDVYAACRRTLAAHSKSFALAAALLGARDRDRLAAVYAWCREADDAIDLVPAAAQPAALARLHVELDAIFAGRPPDRPAAIGFADVVDACGIPRAVPAAFLDGLAMDARGTRYAAVADVERYAYHVAGTVGIMACHTFGVRTPAAHGPAADLGIAMQLTNICRDVREDWDRGRLYLPAALLGARAAALDPAHGGPLPHAEAPALRAAVRALLDVADRRYRSADAGMALLPPRPRVAVRAARLVYAAIGGARARRAHDVHGPRAVVPRRRQLALVVRAMLPARRPIREVA